MFSMDIHSDTDPTTVSISGDVRISLARSLFEQLSAMDSKQTYILDCTQIAECDLTLFQSLEFLKRSGLIFALHADPGSSVLDTLEHLGLQDHFN